ncbi:MAG: hypothetical protein QW416_03625 [Candidatus Nitrosocaldaceae archaeon]
MSKHYESKGFNTRKGIIVLVAIVVIIWMGIGLQQQSERVQEAEDIEEQLPTIWLAYKDNLYKGEMKGYCWFGRCKDNEQPLNITHITVNRNDRIGFVVNSIVNHDSLDIKIYNSIINSNGNVSILDAIDYTMPKVVQDVYTIDLEYGTYVIIVNATWKDREYVEYIFSVKVV